MKNAEGEDMRRKDREVADIDKILDIVEQAKVLHLGMLDGEYPYVVAMHYGYEYLDGTLVFFVHSAKDGHKIDLLRENANVCVELDCNVKLISGGDIACQYGASYASVMGRGKIEIVEDEQEKIHGLQLLMQNQAGREFFISEQMAESVAVLKIRLDNFSAKARIDF